VCLQGAKRTRSIICGLLGCLIFETSIGFEDDVGSAPFVSFSLHLSNIHLTHVSSHLFFNSLLLLLDLLLLSKVPIESFAPTGEDAVPEPVFTVPVMAEGLPALERVNASMGLGFDAQDLKYYLDLFVNSLKRSVTLDVVLYSSIEALLHSLLSLYLSVCVCACMSAVSLTGCWMRVLILIIAPYSLFSSIFLSSSTFNPFPLTSTGTRPTWRFTTWPSPIPSTRGTGFSAGAK